MKTNHTIQLKAGFLLVLFSLNMLVGAACAMGLNLPLQKGQHSDAAPRIHIHKDGKQHIHKAQKQAQKSSHNHSHAEKGTTATQKFPDDCCTTKVVSIAKEDKAIPGTVKIFTPSFTDLSLPVFFQTISPALTSSYTSPRYFVRGHHPPIPEILLAIQRFQI